MRIGIVGAGMAGLACAEGLAALGCEVALIDKGRGPGGRMSTRRLATPKGEAAFDHGAQYFTVRDKAFRRRVEAWLAAGVVARWPAAGDDAFVGAPGMNAPVREMASRQQVVWSTRVTRLEAKASGWRLSTQTGELLDFDVAVIATPAEQAAELLAEVAPDLAARAKGAPSQPCWTLILAFASRVEAKDCGRGEGVIGWAARNSSKPVRAGPESWVVQAGPDWSRTHLEDDPATVALALKQAFAERLGAPLPPILAEDVHRWRFARSGAEGSGAIWDAARSLGVCGDWLIGPRVEAAWLSGTDLAARIGALC
jgi:hypothetical protein